MAALLVRLKLRLLINGLRADHQRRLGLPLIVVALVAGGWWAASSFYQRAGSLPAAVAGEYSIWVVSLGWALWVVMPVLFFPLDEPLDPLKLALLPWSRARLMLGLAGSGLVTITVVVPLLVLAADVALFATPMSVVVVLAGAGILLLMLVAGTQAFTNLVSLILRHRRGRDTAFLLVAGLGLALFVLYQAITSRIEEFGLAQAVLAHPISGWSLLFPPAAAQSAIVAAAAGRVPTAFVNLLAAALWLVALTLVWSMVIDRLVTTPGGTSLSHLTAGRRRQAVAVTTPRAAIFRNEVRAYLRDPRLRMVWTGGAVFLGLLVASLLIGATRLEALYGVPWLPMVGPVIVLFIGLPVTLNQMGWERNAVSFLFALPARPRVILLGKNQAAAGALLVEGLVMSIALAAVSGGWQWLPHALPIAVTAVLCQLAVGNVVSVVAPLRLPPMGTDLFAQATEQGCLSILSQAFAFFLIGLLLMPSAVAYIVVAAGLADPWAIGLGSVLWGALMYWLGLAVAGGVMARRVPELVAAVETKI